MGNNRRQRRKRMAEIGAVYDVFPGLLDQEFSDVGRLKTIRLPRRGQRHQHSLRLMTLMVL